MTIRRYVPKQDRYLYVGYWRGVVADFVDMPHFQELVVRITLIEPNLNLHIDMGDGSVQICCSGSYLCWSEDTGFIVMGPRELQEKYEPMVVVAEEPK